nr:zinc finger, CCHC-type [Tanacetum cinerariifolium]
MIVMKTLIEMESSSTTTRLCAYSSSLASTISTNGIFNLSQYSYCYSIEEEPRTYDEAMPSRDVAFWKEAIDDEIGSIMENNTWVLSDLPPGCTPLESTSNSSAKDSIYLIHSFTVLYALRRSGIENKQARYNIYTVKRSSQNQRIRRRRYNLISAESKFKNLMLDHQDKDMMKAQVHVSKSSAISDEQALPQRKHHC